MLQVLCHALGYAGVFWDVASRGNDTRLHLALSLTQEFLPVSASVPPPLYGDHAISFYRTTMLPPRFLRFPTGIPGLLNALTIRWGYFHGSAVQKNITLLALLPMMLKDCVHLRQFLNPSLSGASQSMAYTSILQLLAPNMEGHRYETVVYIDQQLSAYVNLLVSANASPIPIYAEARVALLTAAVESQRRAVADAPTAPTPGAKAETEGPASKKIVETLLGLSSLSLIHI